MPFCSLVIIIIIPREFFSPTLADGLSLKFKWQLVSSDLQDSLCIQADFKNFDSLISFSDFQLLQSSY